MGKTVAVCLSERDDSLEVLVIQLKIGELLVLCVGVGPQENNMVERKIKFWERLSSEVEEAHENDTAFILKIDENLWAGQNIVKKRYA